MLNLSSAEVELVNSHFKLCKSHFLGLPDFLCVSGVVFLIAESVELEPSIKYVLVVVNWENFFGFWLFQSEEPLQRAVPPFLRFGGQD